MIFISNAEGVVTLVGASQVNQGSNKVNEIIFVGPFPASNAVAISVELPNGQFLFPDVASPASEPSLALAPLEHFSGLLKDANGVDLNAWQTTLEAPITSFSGTLTVTFLVVDGDGTQLATASTSMTVSRGIPNNLPSLAPTQSDWNVIVQAIAAAQGAEAQANQAASSAQASEDAARDYSLVSEGYAVGTQNGVPPGDDSPYNNNNAKSYAQLTALIYQQVLSLTDSANAYKNAAAESATAATNSATAAASSASEAAASANSANLYKRQAETAKSAAESARDSARGFRDEALSSKNAAASSASSAASSASNALTSANNAASSATEASNSATEAASSADRAETAVDNATSLATDSEASALESEGWATGTQNGTPVAASSPYYENNAKYYASLLGDNANEVRNITSIDTIYTSLSELESDMPNPTNGSTYLVVNGSQKALYSYDSNASAWVLKATLKPHTAYVVITGARKGIYRYTNSAPYLVSAEQDFVCHIASDLNFSLDSSTMEYTVTGRGNGSGGHIYIPATKDSLPVTKIAASAFQNDTALTSVYLPESITEIGNYAFSGCANLARVEIPRSCTTIGNNAFNNGYAQAVYIIPSTVTTIGANAFNNGSVYTDAPEKPAGWSFTYLNVIYNVALDDIGIYNVGVRGGTTTLTYDFNADGKTLVVTGLTDASTFTGPLIIPATYNGYPVTEIGLSAFSGCAGITLVDLPDTLVTIKSSAFYGCSGLTVLTIPSSVKYIESSAFNGCTNLTRVELSDLIEIGRGAILGGSVFGYCTSLRYVKMGIIDSDISSTLISNFIGCTNLSTIEISAGSTTFPPLGNLPSLKHVNIPPTITSLVGAMLGGVFSYDTALEALFIPKSVTSIGQNVFKGCTNLTIYAEAESKPDGWVDGFNPDNCPIIYGSAASPGAAQAKAIAYVDAQIGDINTALTSIIAAQNAIIGEVTTA